MRSTWLCLALLIAGCGDDYNGGGSSTAANLDGGTTSTGDNVTSGTTGSSGSFGADVQPIFTQNCAVSGCHAGSSPRVGLNLEAGKSFDFLVGVQSAAGSCTNLKRVEPGNPAQSALVLRLEGSTCGPRMPFGGLPLPDAQIETVKAWIQAGADKN